MSQTLETLGRQIAGMESIHSVVHTMKTLSVINSAPYEQAARAIQDYHRTVLDGLHALFTVMGYPDLTSYPTGQRHIVVFGSDHGLCGTYNEGIAVHVAEAFVGDADITCIGAKIADALRDRGLAPSHVFLPAASVDGLARLASHIAQHIDTVQQPGQPRDVTVELAYVSRDANGVQKPGIVPLLPLSAELVADLRATPWKSRARPMFSMPPQPLFRGLIRAHVFASLLRAAAEAMLAENAARLALMQQAERSVEDQLEVLRSQANTLRQDDITTELLDVIVGFEALEAADRKARLAEVKRRNSDGKVTEVSIKRETS